MMAKQVLLLPLIGDENLCDGLSEGPFRLWYRDRGGPLSQACKSVGPCQFAPSSWRIDFCLCAWRQSTCRRCNLAGTTKSGVVDAPEMTKQVLLLPLTGDESLCDGLSEVLWAADSNSSRMWMSRIR